MIDRLVTTQCVLPYHKSTDSLSLRAIVITNNKKKFDEFRTQLSDGYGMQVKLWCVSEDLDVNDEVALREICEQIIENESPSPHFILREDTTMTRESDKRDITTMSLEELAKLSLQSVTHTSTLTVCKPQWTGENENKTFSGFTVRQYKRRSYGYIAANAHSLKCKHGFGWDAIFVNAATNLTNEQFYERYGKKSARQHVVSDFIETYLHYKALRSMKHHAIPSTRPIDFGEHYISPAAFVTREPNMSNPHIGDWFIDKLRNAKINEGLFFKAAWSRPVGNYFSPPCSGVPLTAKKDAVEETIFLTHDLLHNLVCDLVCDLPPSREGFYVYSAWRMMSEACTMVLADMFYADGLIKSGVDRAGVDKRIYPLFEAIKRTQRIADAASLATADKIAIIKRVLSANVRYALLGDDGGFRELLQSDGVIDTAALDSLSAYKFHFAKFFIGDNAWTRANYDNMQKSREALVQWVNSVGTQTFAMANIPMLSDIMRGLQDRGTRIGNYKELVLPLFEYLFEIKIKPHLMAANADFLSDSEIQSAAFRRFMIGQSSIFSRYPTPLNLQHIPQEIFARLQNPDLFSRQEQSEIRDKLQQYILGLEGLRLLSRAEALNSMECIPVFPPVYISYARVQKQFHTIEECVEDRIASYGEASSPRGMFAVKQPAVLPQQETLPGLQLK